MKGPIPRVDKLFQWCPLEWVEAWYPTFLNSARNRVGMWGRPWSAVPPNIVEEILLKQLKIYMKRALEKLLLKPDECLISFSIAPKGDNIDKTVAEFRRLRSKLLDEDSRILAYMVVPEPRPIGTAHGNILVKCLATNAMSLKKTFDRKLEKEGKIYKFWEDRVTGELTYTHEEQVCDARASRIPGPIWYALKTTRTKVHKDGLQRHNIIAEITKRARSEKDASAIEASAWRKYVGLNISFSQKSREPSTKHPSTLTYSKHQIPPLTPRRLPPFVQGYMLVHAATVRREKLLGSRGR
jgi:hypothetical protein